MGTNLRWAICLLFSFIHSTNSYWAPALVQTLCGMLRYRDTMLWSLSWENFFPNWEKDTRIPLQERPTPALRVVWAESPYETQCLQDGGLHVRSLEIKFQEPRFFSVAEWTLSEHFRNSKLQLSRWLFHFKKHLDWVRLPKISQILFEEFWIWTPKMSVQNSS